MTRAERDNARLLEKIRQAGVPLPSGVGFRATRAGRSARSAGAWVWFLVDADGMYLTPEVGSQWPRSALRGGIEASWDRHTDSWQVDPAKL